jgi:putative acetyltransferase
VPSVDPDMRRATPADAPAMAVAHTDSIRTLGPAFYSAELVDVWAAAVTPDMYLRAMEEGEVFFIAVESRQGKEIVLGFSSHRPAGGADSASVYVRGDASRRGIGTALLRLAEAHAVAQGATDITIQASLPGVAFYTVNGFEEIGPDHATLHTGAFMPCVVMCKRLAPPRRADVV